VTSQEIGNGRFSLKSATSSSPLDYYLHNSSFLNPPKAGNETKNKKERLPILGVFNRYFQKIMRYICEILLAFCDAAVIETEYAQGISRQVIFRGLYYAGRD